MRFVEGRAHIAQHTDFRIQSVYQRYRLKIVDHFAQDGLAPLLSQKVDKWDENQFKTWCDYHYSVCREQSILGASNHVVIIGKK